MRPRILSVQAPATSRALDGRGGRIVYWSWRETSGAGSSSFRLWDGSSAVGRLVGTFSLLPNESVREFPGFHSLPYDTGLFLEVLAGTFEGQVTIIPVDEWPDAGGIPVFVIGSVDLTVFEGGA